MASGQSDTTVFLRNDDVGALTSAFVDFQSCFLDRGLPVSHQVIPALLTDECSDFLRESHAACPGLLEFGQHGLAHGMTINGRKLGWEFGPERDLATQERVIAEGRAILADKLDRAFSGRLFTPPRHRFNADTVVALARQGFEILSGAAYTDAPRRLVYATGRAFGLGHIGNRGITYHGRMRPEARIHEMSIAIAVDNGAPCDRSVAEVLAELERARHHTDKVGLMFHHNAWGSARGRSFLSDLAEALAALDSVRFALPGQIVAGGESSAEPVLPGFAPTPA